MERIKTCFELQGEQVKLEIVLIDGGAEYRAEPAFRFQALQRFAGRAEGNVEQRAQLALRDELSRDQVALEELRQDPDDFGRAVALMRRHHALDDTIARARHYGAMARDALGIFPEGREKRALIEVVDFCIERGH